ncbi:MAG: exopolysaccharide biosynthesis polyprenyl glycosylphosphotransferase [Gammaproteobacteria bacterium]
MNKAKKVIELEESKSHGSITNLKHRWVISRKHFYKSGFFNQLRSEMLRAQRSGSPLSVLILAIEDEPEDKPDRLDNVFDFVRRNTRDTDFIGLIDNNTIGVILPYTNQTGCHQIAKKLDCHGKDLSFSVETFTYPDKIFESLAECGCIEQNAFILQREDSLASLWIRMQLKRIIDVVGSITLLVIFLPIMLITALAIRLTSSGPIIFTQSRLGRHGIPFNFYKFRSMFVNNDDGIHRAYVQEFIKGNNEKVNNGQADKPLYKLKSDPRITKVGKFIRKTSIDELPQLFNVLKGDMSLVGPRPPLAYEAEKYQTWHLRRILDMKPGITGLWQVEGRGKAEWDDSVRLDIRYIKHWSLKNDLKILFKTVKEVLMCRGAM